MSHEATRKLTDSALLMAVSMVLFVGAFVPLLGILVAPFSPLPLCMLAMRYGPRHGALVGLTAIGALSLVFSPVYGAAFLPFVYVGLVLGIMGHLQASGGRIWVVGTLSTLALLWALFAGYNAYAAATGRMATFEQLSGRVFDRAHAVTERLGALCFKPDAEVVRASLTNLEQFRGVARGALAVPLLPLLFLSVMGFSLSYLVAWLLLPKVGFQLQGLPPFAQWRTPWPLAWGFIASLVAYEWGGSEGLTYLWVVSVFDAFVLVYVVMGISILEHYLAGFAVPWPLRCVVYGAALLWLTFPPVPALTVLGVLDPFVDVRRFRGSAPGAASESSGG